MAVPEAKDVPHNGGGSNAARVVEAHGEPGDGGFVLFGEVVPHHRLAPLAYLLKDRDHRFSLPAAFFPRGLQRRYNMSVVKVVRAVSANTDVSVLEEAAEVKSTCDAHLGANFAG